MGEREQDRAPMPWERRCNVVECCERLAVAESEDGARRLCEEHAAGPTEDELATTASRCAVACPIPGLYAGLVCELPRGHDPPHEVGRPMPWGREELVWLEGDEPESGDKSSA